MIDRGNKRIPVYMQIKDWILKKIQEGDWLPHHKMPAEEDLAKQFSVARGTIRQALSELANEGILYRIHGRGTFVASNCFEHTFKEGKFLTFLEELVEKGVSYSTKVLGQWIDYPSKAVASYLNISRTNDKIIYIKRLRTVDDCPIMLTENHIPYNLCPLVEQEDFSSVSLYQFIEEKCNIHVNNAIRLFEAVAAKDDVAKLLNVKEGTPIIFVKQIAYDNNGKCLDCAYLWIRSDKIRLSEMLKRE